MAEMVERDVWIPVKHPLSGKRVNVRAMACDRLVSEAEAEQLAALFSGPPQVDEREDPQGPA